MPRDPTPTWTFALVVVRDGDRFLLVQERKPGNPWFLPAGRVEPGERIIDGAIRETLEESGVHVELEGILKIQHTPSGRNARLRVIFLARPVGGAPGPTEDSLDARWVTRAEIDRLHLRGDDVKTWIGRADGPVGPLDLLGEE
ncbi:MAG: NUDIX domain-containing protein [Alphaproteobacteria bacterium]|nr:NUDIX domain-containing protein [Alphaproteobacteria bacterium]